MFDNIKRDFVSHGREFWNWGFRAMVVYRFGRWRYGISNKLLRLPFSFLYKWMFFRMKARGIEVPCEAEIGDGFRIDHQGGIVISGYAKIGANCVVRNGVTIGIARTDDLRAPVIGDDVDIGTGAKLLGAITIGNRVRIGANAVVLKDLPSDCTAVGIPARILERRGAP